MTEVEQRLAGTSLQDRRRLPSRWLMWSVLALCYFMVYFQRIAPGVVADRLMADFAVGGAAVGLLTAIYLYMYAIMQIPAGALADGFGVRRTVTLGTSLTGVGSLLFGLAPSLEISYLGRFLVGLGVSVIFVAVLKFQGNWFRASEFGSVSGLLVLVGSLGGVVATTPVAFAAQWMGWRFAFMMMGAITIVLAIATWWWVRDRPHETGWMRGGESRRAEVATLESRAPGDNPSFRDEALRVWGNRQTWAGLLAHFGLFGSYLTLYGLWAVPYLMHVHGFDRIEAANYLLVGSTGLLVSAPFMGHVSDRVLRRRKSPAVALALLACGVWFAFTFWGNGQPSTWALYPLFAMLGFSAGNVTLILSAVKEANPPRLSGLAMGTANSGFLCAAFLQPAVGWMLDSHWQGAMEAGARVYPAIGYQVMMGVMTLFALVGLAGTLLLRETRCQNVSQKM